MAARAIGADCAIVCDCVLLAHDRDAIVCCKVLIRIIRQLSSHDILSWSTVLVRLALISRRCHLTLRLNLCLHLICGRFGLILTPDDNQQTDCKTELNRRSCLYHEQDRLPIHFLIHAIFRHLDLLRDAVWVFVLAVLVLCGQWALLQQESGKVL